LAATPVLAQQKARIFTNSASDFFQVLASLLVLIYFYFIPAPSFLGIIFSNPRVQNGDVETRDGLMGVF